MSEIGIFRNCFSKGKHVDQVHEFVDRVGVAGPQFHRGLHGGRWPGLVRSRPSGHSGPRRHAARVATGRARRSATGGPLTGARATTRRRRTSDDASAPSGHGAGMIEEGWRRGEGVRCSTGVRVPFYRVGRGAGAAGNGERRWQLVPSWLSLPE
jgi:hypothetical protein